MVSRTARQGVELAALHRLEQPPHLPGRPPPPAASCRLGAADAPRSLAAQVALRGRPRAAAPRSSWRAPLLDPVPELGHALPASASVRTIAASAHGRVERDHRPHLLQHRPGGRVVHPSIAITSGISMIPAFSAWTESPEPGISTSRTMSAMPIHLDLALPGPDRLQEHEILPGSVDQEQRLDVASASPPRRPRVPIERMYTPGSRKWSASRIRSPRSAPAENGLEGSTNTTPTLPARGRERARPRADQRRLPDAGGPVTPDQAARPVSG